MGGPRCLAAPDKFRGTVTAGEVAASIARGASPLGWSVHEVPLSDGGEGLLEALAGLDGTIEGIEVEGPLGPPVDAAWLRIGNLAVVEMAQASGLALAGGAEGKRSRGCRPTAGTGQLIMAAARALADRSGSPGPPVGAAEAGRSGGSGRTIVVGLGGSATTDGGAGAVEFIEEAGGLGDVALVGACDVDVGFVEAAERFGPQKGAGPDQIAVLKHRLEAVAGGTGPASGSTSARSPGPEPPEASVVPLSPWADDSGPGTTWWPSCSGWPTCGRESAGGHR